MMHPTTEALPVAVVIASKGRPAVLGDTLESVLRLQGNPEIVLVVTCPADLGEGMTSHPRIRTLIGPVGATFQRNAGIAALNLDSLEAVVFFDDDVEVHPAYLVRLIAMMRARSDIVGGSGKSLRDGDVSREEARAMVEQWRPAGPDEFRTKCKRWTLYGCNMYIRASVLKEVRFDENLPSFAFQEDYEISIRLRRLGSVGRLDNAVCVHLKSPGGRVNHRRVSYAMIANNLYFLRKGTVHLPMALAILRFIYVATMLVPFVECHRRFHGGLWEDRRLWWEGCGRAWLDMVRGRCEPSRILQL